MPIQLIIYVIAALSCFATGYYSGWEREHKEVLMLQSSIELSNKVATQKLNEITATVEVETEKQRETITQLEVIHEKTKNDNNSLAGQLATAQLQYRTAIKSSNHCPVPKAGSSNIGANDDISGQVVDTAGLSTELDRLLQVKASIADKIDADNHFLLQWIGSIPPDLIK
jgi:hypothetical protein